jgi:hypothetical protein
MKFSLIFTFLSRLRGDQPHGYPTGGTHKRHPYQNIFCTGVILLIFLAPPVSAEPMKSIESSQLANLQPQDWAVQDLQSVMERVGIFADGATISLTWEQFTADLNVVKSQSNRLSQADLMTLQRLESEFGPELAAMGKRVAQLETKILNLLTNAKY